MKNKWIPRILTLIALIAAGWFFRDQLDFLTEGLTSLQHAKPVPAALVIIFAFGSVAAMAETMRLLIRAGTINVPLRETYAITLSGNAWSTTLPAGPAFSAALTFKVQRNWGASVALCSYFLFLSSVLSSMFLALIGVAGFFFLNADLALGSLITTIILMVTAATGIFWLSEHPSTVQRWLSRIKNERITSVIAELDNLRDIHLTRKAFAAVAGFSLTHRLFDMLALWASVWAVTGEIPWLRSGNDATTMAGVALSFLAAKLAGAAQITPGGLGPIEAALIAPLVATGMTAADATTAAIIYRLISFALVTIIGWVIYVCHYARRGLNYQSLPQKD